MSIIDHDPGKSHRWIAKRWLCWVAVYDSKPDIRAPEQVVETLFDEPLRKDEAAAANYPLFAQRPQPLTKAIFD